MTAAPTAARSTAPGAWRARARSLRPSRHHACGRGRRVRPQLTAAARTASDMPPLQPASDMPPLQPASVWTLLRPSLARWRRAAPSAPTATSPRAAATAAPTPAPTAARRAASAPTVGRTSAAPTARTKRVCARCLRGARARARSAGCSGGHHRGTRTGQERTGRVQNMYERGEDTPRLQYEGHNRRTRTGQERTGRVQYVDEMCENTPRSQYEGRNRMARTGQGRTGRARCGLCV